MSMGPWERNAGADIAQVDDGATSAGEGHWHEKRVFMNCRIVKFNTAMLNCPHARTPTCMHAQAGTAPSKQAAIIFTQSHDANNM